MRLFLSSYRLGSYPEKLTELTGNGRTAAIISNACDARPPELRAERHARECADLGALGFTCTEIDLRNYFDGSFVAAELKGYDLVWVRGGNVFNLRRAMKYSGFDKVITKLLQEDTIVYGGYSAGACVLAPNLHGIEFCDPIDEIPNRYAPDVIWEGLSLIPFAIAPHFDSDHPESPMIDDVVAYFEKQHMPYRTLRDGEVIMVDGANTEKLS